MSLYFQFECTVCRKQGGSLNRYAGERWDADLIATMKFFIHHIRACSPIGFEVRSDMDGDGEFGSRPDVEFVPATEGTFPFSDDWERVAESKDVMALDREWSEWMQQLLEEDALEEE